MEKEIRLRGNTISCGNARITPVIRLHLHCFEVKQALALHAVIEPEYILVEHAGASKIFRISGEEIPADQLDQECPASSITLCPG